MAKKRDGNIYKAFTKEIDLSTKTVPNKKKEYNRKKDKQSLKRDLKDY